MSGLAAEYLAREQSSWIFQFESSALKNASIYIFITNNSKLGSHGWLKTSPPFSPRSRRLPRASCSCGARCWRRGWLSRGGGRASAADTSPPHPTHAARTPTPPRPDQHWLLLFIELQKIHRFSQSRTRALTHRHPNFTSTHRVYTGWVKKKWDLKKYVYCSEGQKN